MKKKHLEYPILLLGVVLVILDAYLNIDFSSEQPLSINVLYFGKSPLMFLCGAIGGIAAIFSISKILSVNKNLFVLACSNGMIIILGFQCIIFKMMAMIILPSYSLLWSIIASVIVLIVSYFMILISSKFFPVLLGYRKI